MDPNLKLLAIRQVRGNAMSLILDDNEVSLKEGVDQATASNDQLQLDVPTLSGT